MEDFFARGLMGFVVICFLWYVGWLRHKDSIKSLMNETQVGQAAKEAAKQKALGMIGKWLK
jgi:hypothetical protein